jgi:diaminopimelate decarboxylase
LCRIIDQRGGFAEIVSEMEYRLAKSIHIKDENIYYNGPYKSKESIESLLIGGGYVNIDSIYEIGIIESIAKKHNDKILKVGIRVNLEINDGVLSRFGFDVKDKSFEKIISRIEKSVNISLVGVHLHIATRSLNTWRPRVSKLIELIESRFDPKKLEFVSLGGGLYGNMPDSLKKQFPDPIPTYSDYANSVAIDFNAFALKHGVTRTLKLLIEPGSALAGDAMNFVSKVINIKSIRSKYIATLAGSIYNINPTLNKKNPPIEVIHKNMKDSTQYTDLDFAGYTCIESDYLYKGYVGKLRKDDYVVFSNVGSYSVVLKPPFILPNFGIVKYVNGVYQLVKNPEKFEDIFLTYTGISK